MELGCGALIECLQKGGSRGPDLSGDSICRHGDERGVRRWSKGLNRVQGRFLWRRDTE
jgi:hypothetical protein